MPFILDIALKIAPRLIRAQDSGPFRKNCWGVQLSGFINDFCTHLGKYSAFPIPS